MNRRIDDHDLWTKADHNRYEDRIALELHALREDVGRLTLRVTLMIGGVGVLGFILPLIAPFVRAWLNLDTPAGQ